MYEMFWYLIIGVVLFGMGVVMFMLCYLFCSLVMIYLVFGVVFGLIGVDLLYFDFECDGCLLCEIVEVVLFVLLFVIGLWLCVLLFDKLWFVLCCFGLFVMVVIVLLFVVCVVFVLGLGWGFVLLFVVIFVLIDFVFVYDV